MRANLDIRSQISNARLRNWEIARAVGISDSTFSKWLRTDLTGERKERVEKAINDLIKQVKE